MPAIRVIGNALLWALAAVGLLSGGLWVANALGLVQPLIVVSGSMEPDIMTGDLIIATRTPVAELAVGKVASLRSAHSGHLVTHRMTAITRDGGGYAIRMQGDANEVPDGESYQVAAGEAVWQPSLVVPGGGYPVRAIARPAVAIPLLISIVALIALTVLPSGREVDAEASATLAETSGS